MSDLIERLRKGCVYGLDKCRDEMVLEDETAALLNEAADELTRLRSLVDQSGGGAEREALEKIAHGRFGTRDPLGDGGTYILDGSEYRKCREIALAALASPPHGGRILEGWRMVPVEPTEDMLRAAHASPQDVNRFGPAWADYGSIYTAMLSAAPVSPLREDKGASRDLRSNADAAREQSSSLVPEQVKP